MTIKMPVIPDIRTFNDARRALENIRTWIIALEQEEAKVLVTPRGAIPSTNIQPPTQVKNVRVTDLDMWVDPKTGKTHAHVLVEWDDNPYQEVVDAYEIMWWPGGIHYI